jgi:NADPH:quinone reductase-like Zn-dependent oxidoreductase
MTVLATTRNPGKAGAVTKAGADHVLIDDGHVAQQVREILPGGADAALELVGTPTLPDTLRSVRVHGVVCFTGMLSNQWTVRRARFSRPGSAGASSMPSGTASGRRSTASTQRRSPRCRPPR